MPWKRIGPGGSPALTTMTTVTNTFHLGADADTTGAVYGQIAGAFYGAAGFPAEWLARLGLREPIEGFAEKPVRR